MRWLYAAYRLGAWRAFMDDGLGREAFTERMLQVLQLGDLDWIIEARGNEGVQPVGLVLGRIFAAGRAVEAHCDWFSWATPRNKLEGMDAFLRDIGRSWKVFVFAEEATVPFWERMRAYRRLRAGCKVLDHFAPGEHAMMFYTGGP